MKKILNLMMLAVLAVCFALPVAGKVEAAKMAVVPLANHVEDNTTANMIYMDEVMAMFKFPEFDMVADDVVEKAVGTAGMVDFSKANLERIARETGADIVVAMSLDTLDDKALFPRREPTLKLDMSGEFAFLNKVTGRIDLKYGLTTTNFMEASVNRAMIDAAQKIIVLTDSSKFGRRGFGKICELDAVDQIITDSGVSSKVANLR